MRVIHILDHSISLQSGYTFRTLAILKERRAPGRETFHRQASVARYADDYACITQPSWRA
ncbi:MAG: hypothetical protein OER43_00065 [Gammaproteobacteria bacterium]|nr:hypothetical protein [Gammaproteobacteria bacterium]MDH3412103.1 hypothetical protein [Gammaproteobacteria bacterium]